MTLLASELPGHTQAEIAVASCRTKGFVLMKAIGKSVGLTKEFEQI
jgi:hypothetical protein